MYRYSHKHRNYTLFFLQPTLYSFGGSHCPFWIRTVAIISNTYHHCNEIATNTANIKRIRYNYNDNLLMYMFSELVKNTELIGWQSIYALFANRFIIPYLGGDQRASASAHTLGLRTALHTRLVATRSVLRLLFSCKCSAKRTAFGQPQSGSCDR